MFMQVVKKISWTALNSCQLMMGIVENNRILLIIGEGAGGCHFLPHHLSLATDPVAVIVELVV